MGQSSKKKKKSGVGRRNKGRTSSKDHNSIGEDNSELVAEELTALCAIFQEDCEVVSKSPSQIHIKLRPYSKDAGYEDSDVSALLSVRCLPGYPYKCPKLQIIPEKGLSKADSSNLLSLLYDQASSNAREGRVMIYNLVEAAQEFLSEIVPQERLHGPVSCQTADITSQLTYKDATVSSGDTCSFGGPFVYGFVDLFSGSGESWHWSLGINDNGRIDSLVESHVSAGLNHEYDNQPKKIDQIVKPALNQEAKQESLRKAEMKLDEESEGESKCGSDLGKSYTDESIEDHVMCKNIFLEGNLSDCGDAQREPEPEPSVLVASGSLVHDHLPNTLEKDLILAHLLRLACGPKGPLSDALLEITSELFDLGIVSKRVQDLATKPSIFDGTFDNVFQSYKLSSKLSQFWKASTEFEEQNSSPPQNSRYLNDFEEQQPLGQGGFGHVVLCKNKLDGRQYAMKKIRLKDKILPLNDRIVREVATLSRLQHQHIVRYYQAWFETGITVPCDDSSCSSRTVVSSSFTYVDGSVSDHLGQENKLESTYLYIQMEYCPRTLRQMFESYSHLDKELAWHLFRQIVEGLTHIHGQGIIHRDLTPNNIFFDTRNDIKIGDFGLAKFLKLEQLDQDVDAAEMIGVSVDGTGQVGTYFYTAPEIEQMWPKINEKADMYSLGVVFFELWHPFDTAMERHIVLSDLKQKGEVPPAWAAEFPEQASLLRCLMSPSPSDRPSAVELLQNAFPPRMEYEMLDNILRTIHASDDTGVYDKIVNAIFNEDTLNSKGHNTNLESSKVAGRDTSCILFTDLQTESRDHIVEIATETFRRHCAKHLEIIPVRMLGECPLPNSQERNGIKLLTHGGDMVELCHELRLPLVKWIVANRRSFFKRYEIAYVYRRAIGHSPPNRYLQGDFDIIGGETALTEAEIIKATMDIILHYFQSESCDIHLNHADLLDAIWTWAGIRPEHRQKVAELLSLLGSLRPQSSERKTKWVVIRRQLRQELNLAETAVNRLQTVGLRFCGVADQALPRLRGALPPDKTTRKALEDLSELFNYLRVWRLDQRVYVDALMPPTESYHRNLFFQIYLRKDDNPGSLMEGTLLAVGGRYDYLLHQSGDLEYKSNTPGAAGSSLALETILQHASLDIRPHRYDAVTNVLVCSRGGGGLLIERMELLAELWEENIRAEFVPLCDPSLTEQYEYANEHDIKCLVIITDTGVSQKDSVKVRHLELKKEKEVERGNLVKFLLEAMSSQFRNPSIWN